MKQPVCGRCYHERGKKMQLSEFKSKDTKKTLLYCAFCNEERHPGGFRTRVQVMPDMGKGEENEVILNIPHIAMVEV